ncbi:MAG: UDP-2,3-diacylglucosamine diphosphatase [Alteromonadaceae bacterium]|nr:UDP-2,3-diacylglucosamine diphosphatase [Alteromonadaceae bacterium]
MIYFIADLHLSADRPDITACFLSFLKNDAPQATQLYILGDLFEYWVGDDDDSVFVNTIATTLKQLADNGTKLFFIHGNRDFLLGKKYAKKAGLILLPETHLIDLFGQKALIMHGDTLCTRDVDYQKFRKKSRSWWWQFIIKSLPLKTRKKIAANYRKKSTQAKQIKSLEIMDVTQSEVKKQLTNTQSLLLIHGHTHRPNEHHFYLNNDVNAPQATRIVLGDWYEQGAWLKVTADKIELLNKHFE